MKNIMQILLATLFASALVACSDDKATTENATEGAPVVTADAIDSDGTLEQAGEAADETLEAAKENVEDAADTASNKVKQAAQDIEDAAEEAADKMDKAMEDMKH